MLNVFSKQTLFQQVDNSGLVVFRVVFGFLILAEGWGAIATGWVHETFIEPQFTFTFMGFEWLKPLPGNGMYIYFAVMGTMGLLVMLGLFYRYAIVSYGIMWTCVYLMQKSHYNNHYYLLVLLLAFMALMPAHKYFSLDVRLNRVKQALTCPRWCYIVFILKLFVVYTYASFSKVYDDWLVAAPIENWFLYKKDYWLIGPLLQYKWVHYAVAYGGILFDGLVIPALLWRRTRWLAFGIGLFFHLFNSAVFHIGIFPYMMIGTAVFFFPQAQVRAFFFKKKPPVQVQPVPANFTLSSLQKVGVVAFTLYFALQILLPVRYHLYKGNVHWTEEGHRLAWKMMLRAKSGSVSFVVKDPATEKVYVARNRDYVTPNQDRKMAVRPDMIWQLAQRIKKDYQANKGIANPQVYIRSRARLNNHKYYPLIDPEVDLGNEPWHRFKSHPWITNLAEMEAAEAAEDQAKPTPPPAQ